MKQLSTEDFNRVMKEGNNLILYFYRRNNATCHIQSAVMEEIDRLISKPFLLYAVDMEQNPEIRDLFEINDVPFILTVKNQKVYKKCAGLQQASAVLNMLK